MAPITCVRAGPTLVVVLLLLGAASAGCQGQTESFAGTLDRDDVVPAARFSGATVLFHRNLGVVEELQPLLLETLRLGLDSIARHVPVRDLEIRVMVFPDPVLPMFGLSGVAGPTRIDVFLDPGNPGLERGIREALIPTLVHEYHHALRERAVEYGPTLFEAMISEGLAEQFVMEVTGRRPPWMGPPAPERWLAWRRRAAAVWCTEEYDHAAWFVGTTPEIPRGTGFEVGAELVGDYLARHPDARPSTLHATPGRAFLPEEMRGDAAADCWLSAAVSRRSSAPASTR